MMHRSGLSALAALFLLGSTTLLADSFGEARDWLNRMSVAMQDLDYQGTFVYVRGSDVETLRLTHVTVDEVVHERMVAVSGPQREVMRDDKGVRALIGRGEGSGSDPLLTGAVFPSFSVDALGKAKKRYLFEVGGTGRIAGHVGRKISIIPKDQFRFGYELWLEEETGLLLRWVLYDQDRRPLAKLMFTEMVTGEAVNHDDLKSPTSQQQFVQIETNQPELAMPSDGDSERRVPDGIPPGFGLAAHSSGAMGEGTEQLVFSDGLASVSIYLESDSEPGGVSPGLTRMGTTSVWSGSRKGTRVTAVGEVPPKTLKTMGKAFLAPGGS